MKILTDAEIDKVRDALNKGEAYADVYGANGAAEFAEAHVILSSAHVVDAEPVATYDDQVMHIVRESLKSFEGKELLNSYESAMMEESIERAYWIFDAMHKGLGEYKGRPKSERDAFKAVMRLRMEAERVASKVTRKAQEAYTRLAKPSASMSVPDGWKLVPIEPTDEMLRAGNEATFEDGTLVAIARRWSGMLTAAPSNTATVQIDERAEFEKWLDATNYTKSTPWGAWQARASLGGR